MAEAFDNRYSRFVAVMKWLLPLAALAIMSTIFLWARAPIGSDSIPYAELDEIAREERLSQPRYSGVTADGARISITAEMARPNGQAIEVERIAAEIIVPDGPEIEITARLGTIDTGARTARLSGLARLITSTGYAMETTGLAADLESGRVISEGPVEARTPKARLTSGGLTVEPGGQVMLFSDGVTLIYEPGGTEGGQ